MKPICYLTATLKMDLSAPFVIPADFSVTPEDISPVSQHTDLKHAILRCVYDISGHAEETGEFLPMVVLVKEGNLIRTMNSAEIEKSEDFMKNLENTGKTIQ